MVLESVKIRGMLIVCSLVLVTMISGFLMYKKEKSAVSYTDPESGKTAYYGVDTSFKYLIYSATISVLIVAVGLSTIVIVIKMSKKIPSAK